MIGDTEECKIIEWGGFCMLNIHKDGDLRRTKDYLFRGPDEIPKGYEWDDGEYEGWLQFRWGDGKNTIGYVEPQKSKKKIEKVCGVSEGYTLEEFAEVMDDLYIDTNDREYEQIENSFLKEEDIEKLKRLANKW